MTSPPAAPPQPSADDDGSQSNLLVVHSHTHAGRVRNHNEDSVYPLPGEQPGQIRAADGVYQLLVVADGMGGHAEGEQASSAAIAALCEIIERGDWTSPETALREAFRVANERVHSAADDRGTTLVAALVKLDSHELWIANVGDSHIYLASDGTLTPLTRDHSNVADAVAHGRMTAAQARTAPGRNVLTRAIGPFASVEVDVHGPLTLEPGQRLLLCSDGLYSMVADADIAPLAWSTALEQAPEALVEAANAAGGQDNITVLMAALPPGAASGAASTVGTAATVGVLAHAPEAVPAATVAVAPLPLPATAAAPKGRSRVPLLAVAFGALAGTALLVGALTLRGGGGESQPGDGAASGTRTASPTNPASRTAESTPVASNTTSTGGASTATATETAEAASATATASGTPTPGTTPPPVPTPVPGPPGSPTMSDVSCPSATVGQAVTCSVAVSGADSIVWTSNGNPTSQNNGQSAYTVTFGSSGFHAVSARACNSTGCTTRTTNVAVTGLSTPTPSPGPNTPTATATATPTAAATPTPVQPPPDPTSAPQPTRPGCPPLVPNCPPF